MQELLRIIGNRKYIGVLCLLLVINGILFWREMQPEPEVEEYNIQQFGENYKTELEAMYEKLEEKYDAMEQAQAIEELNVLCEQFTKEDEEFWLKAMETWDGTGQLPRYEDTLSCEQRIYRAAVRGISGSYNYMAGYQDGIREIIERAEKMEADTGVFAKDSFAGKNIIKTKEDFGKIMDVVPEYGPQDAFNVVCQYNLSDFLMLAGVFAAVVIVLDERKKGLWDFVYATVGGRRQLAGKRIFVMGMVAALTVSVVFLENLVLAGWYYRGYGDLLRPIQSMQICERVTMQVSVLGYLMLLFIWKVLVLFLIGLLLLLLVLAFKKHIQIFLIFGVAMIAEYLAYVQLDVHSKYVLLKYINLFAWMDVEWCMSNYLNLNIFGYPVSVYTIMTVLVPVILVVLGILLYISGSIRPSAMRESRLFRMLSGTVYRLKPYRHGSMFLTECYKQFWVQKMWLIVVLAWGIAILSYDDTEVNYDYSGTLYQAYMNQVAGDVTDEKLVYLENERGLWQEKYEEQQAIMMQPGVSQNEYDMAKRKTKQFEQAMNCVAELVSEGERLEKLQQEGKGVRLINHMGYRHYIGDLSFEQNQEEALLLLVLVTMVAAVLFASENAQNAGRFIRSTRNGRGKFIGGKYLTLFVIQLLIFVPIKLSEYLTIQTRYGMEQMDASVYSLSFAEEFPVNLTIGGAMILFALAEFLILYLWMVLVTLLSMKMKNVVAALIISMALVVLPADLYYMGFEQMSLFTILNEMVTSKWMM